MRFKSGLPVAPYNTTQFLLDDLQRRGGNGQPGDDVDVDTIVESIRHRHHKRSEESAAGGAESMCAENTKLENVDFPEKFRFHRIFTFHKCWFYPLDFPPTQLSLVFKFKYNSEISNNVSQYKARYHELNRHLIFTMIII